ncbi:hypothetical protein V498_02839 [Pseudogymnoascus sp. VKM F-4517 (FW-2822)]|nr:hypothetical protein V498_02839 [Pseudogymnoascus sp. VKM F-4517 (FW-2822)]
MSIPIEQGSNIPMSDYSYSNSPSPFSTAKSYGDSRSVDSVSPMPTNRQAYNRESNTSAHGNGVAAVASNQPGGMGLAPEDEFLLNEADVHAKAVAKPMRLGSLTVMCLIFNRMIGTGIFRTPALVYTYTQSRGISMAWWALGAVSAIAGILVYMELGLTIPIYRIGGIEVSVPRSGGELNYLKHIFRKPAFFTTCVFGIAFILLGQVAMNAIAFATSVMEASGQINHPNSEAIIRGIAISTAFAACFIHGVWRQGGIIINNILATVKIAILIFMFILGMLATRDDIFPPVSASEFPAPSSPESSASAYTYAEAFLAIIFAFGGFNQANYVIGEVDNPRRRYKWPAFSAVVIVSVLYLIVNGAYFAAVPVEYFSAEDHFTVAHRLFLFTLGSISPAWKIRAPRLLSSFMAVSSLGNIIVMTYTAARVKQEIAKEGIIPFRSLLSRSYPSVRIPIRALWGSKRPTLREDVPLPALVLHFSVSVILILATWRLSTPATYTLLVDLYSYTVDAVFGAFVGFGLLYMRFLSQRGWAAQSRASGFPVPAYVSGAAALIFAVANTFPVAAKWVPPDVATAAWLTVPWYTTGTVGTVIMAVGVLWWAGFRWVVPRVGRGRVGRFLLVTRKLWLTERDGYKVLEYEDIEFRWVTKDGEDVTGPWMERQVVAGQRETEMRLQADDNL